MKTSRLKNVLKHMEENKIPQVGVTSAQSIFYLTGKMIHSGERLIALYLDTVSYTHLEVYKRQNSNSKGFRIKGISCTICIN